MLEQERIKNKQKIAIQLIALFVGIVLLVAKFFAYLVTNSNSILTDALESIINVVAGGFGLYSLIIASKPKDEDHPYGHGKIEFISASIEGSLICFAGFTIVFKSIFNMFVPSKIEQLDIGIIIISISGIINFMIGFLAERRGRKTDSLTLVASGKHLKTDAYTTIGILVGLILIKITNIGFLDNIVAALAGAWIIYNGILILKESVAGIMDEADFDLLNKIIETLNQQRASNWIDIHNMRTIKYGDKLHVDCHATLPYYFTIEEAHEEIEKIEACITNVLENSLESFIHVDACMPEFSCKICQKTDCIKRQFPMKEKLTWTLKNVVQNKKHGK